MRWRRIKQWSAKLVKKNEKSKRRNEIDMGQISELGFGE